MPIAFHAPVDRPIEAPQPARGTDDGGSGDAFAALLINAGKAPPTAEVGVAAKDSGPRKPHDDPPGFDPLAAFAAWVGTPPPAGAAGAIREPGDSTGDLLKSSTRTNTLAALAAAAADTPSAPDAGTAAGGTAAAAGDATPAAGTPASAAFAVLAMRPGKDGATIAAPVSGPRTPANTDFESATAAAQGATSATAAPAAAPLAQAAALLAKALGAKSMLAATLTLPTAIQRHDNTDAAPVVNLGATIASVPLPPAVTIAQSVGTPGFAAEVAGQMAQLVHINADRAQLHVQPADMGPIDVTLQVRHAQVTVTMVAADPQTRAALELSLPQLRDLLANQGLALTNASVNDQAPRDSGNFQPGQRGSSSAEGRVAAINGAAPVPAAASIALRRLVDLYA
ncbi:MAG: flagellar hook-length control protein FliK [Casimicrobiaceae bacterium]